jgi:transcriptional regulator with XRE-family HTH domain
MDNSFENAKIAIAIRSARTAIGWNQQEFADLMEVAKSTITRVETLEMGAKADFLNRAMRLFRDAGVIVDLYQLDTIPMSIESKAILIAKGRLEDGSLRRSDRKGPLSQIADELDEFKPMTKTGDSKKTIW